MKNTISIKQIVIDFIYIREQIKELFKDKIEYKSIIDFILAKDYLDDDLDLPFPKLKEIENGTGLKPHILRKLLLQMHNRIFNFENNLKLNFSKTLCHFYIKYYDKRCYFTTDKLEFLPRVGENVSLPFVKASLDLDFFFVEEIRHVFEDTTQNIYLTLKVGNYNSYWQYRKDQAIELKEVEFKEIIYSSDTELKKKIYSKNHWHR